MMNKKRIGGLALAAVMGLSLAACTSSETKPEATATADPAPVPGSIAISGESVTLDNLALRPDGEAGLLYENEGLKLMIPLEYDSLLLTEKVTDDAAGELFRVTEKASREAAPDSDGAGWLFSIARVDEKTLHELLGIDRSGADIFARDAEGRAYLFCHPTDVRYYRATPEQMQADQEQWTMLTSWAWDKVRDSFLSENPGLTPVTYSDSELAIAIGRAAYSPTGAYTLSTTEFGPIEGANFDASVFGAHLLENVSYERLENTEAPDGEYVVLTLPETNERCDFFLQQGKENIARRVNGDMETLYTITFPDDSRASEIMRAWYHELAKANNVTNK